MNAALREARSLWWEGCVKQVGFKPAVRVME